MTDAEIRSYILEHFSYEDGKLIRDDRKNSNGSYDRDGYLIVKVKGRQFKAHRIVWLLFHGCFPDREIDHINRNRADNRIENLREADRRIQHENTTRKPNADTGVVGIHYDKSTKGLKKRYTTRVSGKTYRFYTLEEAKAFRKEKGLWV